MNYQNNFARLAKELIIKGDKVRGVKTLDRCLEIMPTSKVPVGYASLFIAEAYYLAGETEKADNLMHIIIDKFTDELKWYISLESPFADKVSGEVERAFQIISNVNIIAGRNWYKTNIKNGVEPKTSSPISERCSLFLNEFAPHIKDYGKRIGQKQRYIQMLRGM